MTAREPIATGRRKRGMNCKRRFVALGAACAVHSGLSPFRRA
jgi:hypothetical protein